MCVAELFSWVYFQNKHLFSKCMTGWADLYIWQMLTDGASEQKPNKDKHTVNQSHTQHLNNYRVQKSRCLRSLSLGQPWSCYYKCPTTINSNTEANFTSRPKLSLRSRIWTENIIIRAWTVKMRFMWLKPDNKHLKTMQNPLHNKHIGCTEMSM